MPKVLRLLMLACALSTIALAQSQGSSSLNDPFYPWMGNGGYDAQDYDIDLRIEYRLRVTGTTTVTALATEDLSRFNLDFGLMDVTEVTVNDQVATFKHADPELEITPTQTIAKGQRFTVKVKYAGNPGSRVTSNTIGATWNTSSDGLSVFGEPTLMLSWTPVNDHPSDKATFTIHLTMPKADITVVNGQLVSRFENNDGTATSTFRIGTPTTTYMVMLASGRYEFQDAGITDGVQYRNYFSPDTTPTFRSVAARAPEMVKFFSDRLGPYPFPAFGVLTTNALQGYGALETQSLVTMAPAFLDSDGKEDPLLTEEVLAHELAHQWFGALVTFRDHSSTFVHEGIAQFLGWEWIEQTKQKEYLASQIRSSYASMVFGEYAYSQDKKAFLQSFRENFSDVSFTLERTQTTLDTFFGSGLSATSRTQILDQAKDAWSVEKFADVLEKLSFTRIIYTFRNYAKLQTAVGNNYPLGPEEYLRWTPPGKLQPKDYVLNSGVYDRGAAGLFALKLKIGEENFYKILRSYLERFKFANASNQDFVNIVAELAGANAKALLEHWLYDDRVPDLAELGLFSQDFKAGADFR